MKNRPWLGLTLALALAACGAPVQLAPTHPPAATHPAAPGPDDAERARLGQPPDGQAYPDGNRFRVLQVDELPIVAVTTDSQASGFPRERLADGNLGTEWMNGGYRNATSWAAVELAETASLASVDIKTGPTASGARYDLQVSEDGATWQTVATGLTNTTWGLENKPLSAGTRGKFVRVFWRNSSSPAAHFSIFELVVNGEAGGVGPTPTPGPTATPTPTPTPTPSSTPTPPPPSGEVVRVTPTSMSASSTYAGLVPARAVDGDLNTQWANGGYQESEATLTLAFDRAVAFDRVAIKTGALPQGVRYRLETSSDGAGWTPVTGDMTNTTWQLETKAVSGQGRYLRIRFYNRATSPVSRFSVFELETYGRQANQIGLTVDAEDHVVFYGDSVGVGGTPYNDTRVEADAFNDVSRGLGFPAMLGVWEGRYGWAVARVTPELAQQWYGALGGPGPVSFLDSVGGLEDNAGSWKFYSETQPDGGTPYAEAFATQHVTLWDPAQVAYIDLGSEVKTWRVDGEYLESTPRQRGVVLVFTRPDGVRDFVVPLSEFIFPSGPDAPAPEPTIIRTRGYVYAFYVTDGELGISDARLTFTEQ